MVGVALTGGKRSQAWDEWGYLACGVLTAAPLVIYPLLFPGRADAGKPLAQRYWVKANLWLGVFGFIGNYFWTHYFFQLLGASYTMPSHRLNDVRCLPCASTAAADCKVGWFHAYGGNQMPSSPTEVSARPFCRSGCITCKAYYNPVVFGVIQHCGPHDSIIDTVDPGSIRGLETQSLSSLSWRQFSSRYHVHALRGTWPSPTGC